MNHYSHTKAFYLYNILDVLIAYTVVAVANGLLYTLFIIKGNYLKHDGVLAGCGPVRGLMISDLSIAAPQLPDGLIVEIAIIRFLVDS